MPPVLVDASATRSMSPRQGIGIGNGCREAELGWVARIANWCARSRLHKGPRSIVLPQSGQERRGLLARRWDEREPV